MTNICHLYDDIQTDSVLYNQSELPVQADRSITVDVLKVFGVICNAIRNKLNFDFFWNHSLSLVSFTSTF